MPSAPFPSRAADRRRAVADSAEPAHAAADFHEPRRPDCPWCGSQRLGPRPAPPGPRRLLDRPAGPDGGRGGGVPYDECGDCGHVFLNPGPITESLARHPGPSAEGPARHPGPAAEALARHPGPAAEGPARHPRPHGEEAHVAVRLLVGHLAARRHRSAARVLPPFHEPESWLDVGTGDGRFPAAAREFFPYTAFDGVDTDRRLLLRAHEAGHVEEAHVGRLTDPHIAARLRARYDVVSLLHHLEGAPDPRAELHAALAVLRPGGHLLIDLTDPRAGRWTPPTRPGRSARPARPHLPLPANVEAELRAEGCLIVTPPRRLPRPRWTYRILARRG